MIGSSHGGPDVSTQADLPPYDPQRMLAAPFPERVRLVCRTWASQVHPKPMIVMAMYWAKYLVLFIGGWAFFVLLRRRLSGLPLAGRVGVHGRPRSRRRSLWSIFYELAGFGCGWGPMNGRFKPPFGGFLHFLRPGTTKLPLVPGRCPLLGGITRTLARRRALRREPALPAARARRARDHARRCSGRASC